MKHSCRETCVCETSEVPQKMLEVAAAALAARESSAVIESGADIAWQLLCVREKLAIEKQAGHQTCRLIIEALVELGLDLPALVAAPYDAASVNELYKSLPAKVRAVVKQRDETVAERDGLRDSRASWQQHCADSANKYADQRDEALERANKYAEKRDEALRQVERLNRELAWATEQIKVILNALPKDHCVDKPGDSSEPTKSDEWRSQAMWWSLLREAHKEWISPSSVSGEQVTAIVRPVGATWTDVECKSAALLGKQDCEGGVRRRSFNAICRAVLGSPSINRPDLEKAYHLAYDQVVEWRAWPHHHPLIAGTRVTNETPARWRFVDAEDRPISWKLIEACQSEDTSK